MKEYEVLRTFWFGGRRYEPGEKIELSDRAATNLVRAGKVESATAAKPKAKAPTKKEGDQ